MRIIVGITGASGVTLGVNLLKALSEIPEIETHLVMTDCAIETMKLETDFEPDEVIALADVHHDINDMAASISSGSFKTDGMIVAPCTMKTLSGIATGYSSNLLLRAVDVCLKERRKVVLITRELPLSLVHLKNMTTVTECGCIVLPPMLTFYNKPQTIQDMINHLIGKTLMMFDIEFKKFVPWK